jgi:DNA-binding CsgD family transcriptional regulator
LGSFVYFYLEIERPMISLVFIIVFVFCLAITGACILIGHQFISTYNTTFHRNYFYYLMSFYAFALYAVWGHILLRTLLTGITTRSEIVESVANFASILGLPFLFISWVMLVNMAYSLFGKSAGKAWITYHMGLIVLLIAGVWLGYDLLSDRGLIESASVRYIQIAYISIFGLINYSVFMALVRRFSNTNEIRGRFRILLFAILMVGAFLIQTCAVVFAFSGVWQLAAVILMFFASNFFPLYYLRANADFIFQPVRAHNSSEESINKIAKKFKITRREQEIVTQICLGKSNQEIADTLFISLQTVKDHTHRIYSKIGIRSRMQLVQLVN